MNPILEMAGKMVLGNIWTTGIGGTLMWANIERVAHLLASAPTIGQVIMSPEFQVFITGMVLPFLRDPKKLPQLFFKD